MRWHLIYGAQGSSPTPTPAPSHHEGKCNELLLIGCIYTCVQTHTGHEGLCPHGWHLFHESCPPTIHLYEQGCTKAGGIHKQLTHTHIHVHLYMLVCASWLKPTHKKHTSAHMHTHTWVHFELCATMRWHLIYRAQGSSPTPTHAPSHHGEKCNELLLIGRIDTCMQTAKTHACA
jgi:hypothetical protein